VGRAQKADHAPAGGVLDRGDERGRDRLLVGRAHLADRVASPRLGDHVLVAHEVDVGHRDDGVVEDRDLDAVDVLPVGLLVDRGELGLQPARDLGIRGLQGYGAFLSRVLVNADPRGPRPFLRRTPDREVC
jgi:hypothetical protein